MAIGNPFTEVSVTGYNPNAPSNDGQQIASNLLDWTKHESELSGPVKTALESTQTAVTSALDKRIGNSVLTKTAAYTITVADRGKDVRLTGASSVTFTLPAVVDAKIGFEIVVSAAGTGTLTVDGASAELIEGAATVDFFAGEAGLLYCDGTGWNIIADKRTVAQVGGVPLAGLVRSSIDGLILSNGTDTDHDIDISEGVCVDGTNVDFLRTTSALTKRIDEAWAVGTNLGGLDTGTVAADTLYYVWMIKRVDTGVVDALFSLSDTSPTMPTDYTLKRLIGAVETDGSANIINAQFMQVRQGKKTFISAGQTITAAGLVTLNTALGAVAGRIWLELINGTDQFGFVAGDVVPINSSVSTLASNARGLAIAMTSGQIDVRYGSDANSISLINHTTGGVPANITNASWTLRIRAEVDT